MFLVFLKADEIVQALQDMDNSASSDAVVREQIAKLPPEVQDTSLLEKIEGLSYWPRGFIKKC